MKNNYALLNRWTTWLWLLISSFAFLPTQAQYLTQNFEGAFSGSPAAPTGWTQEQIRNVNVAPANERDWVRNQYSTGSTWTVDGWGTEPNAVAPGSGGGELGALYIDDGNWNAAGNQIRRMITPVVNLSASTDPHVRFQYHYANASTVLNFRVLASNDGTNWTLIHTPVPCGIVNAWRQATISIPATFKTATARFALEVTSAYGNNGVFVDNFSIQEFTPTINTYTGASAGNWFVASNWSLGIAPNSSHQVVIPASIIVNIAASPVPIVTSAVAYNVVVNGTLQFTTTANVLQIYNDLTVNSGGTYISGSTTTGTTTHIGRNVTVNTGGTINFSNGTVVSGRLVFNGGQAATYTNTGTLTGGRISNIHFANSGGVSFANPVEVKPGATFQTSQIVLVAGTVNGTNLTIGNSAFASHTQLIEVIDGTFSTAPTFNFTNVTTRNISYLANSGATLVFRTHRQGYLKPMGNEIPDIAGVRTVNGTLAFNTHNNISMPFNVNVTGGLTLTRGIVVTGSNILRLNNTIGTTPAGTGPSLSTISPPTTHGSYVAGNVEIEALASGTATRNVPLGIGTSLYSGSGLDNRVLGIVLNQGTTAWSGQVIRLNTVTGLTGTVNAPGQLLFNNVGIRIQQISGTLAPEFGFSYGANRWVGATPSTIDGNSDKLDFGDRAQLFMSQSTSPTGGTWSRRSFLVSAGNATDAFGTGAFADNAGYSGTTVVTNVAPGPITPLATNGEYFALASTADPCASPTALGATPSLTSASFSWTEPGVAPGSGYIWEVRSSGAAGSGAVGLVASGTTGAGVTTASATGLASTTSYTLYVRSNCNPFLSSWVSSVFGTLPCLPTYTFGKTDGDLISNVVIVGTTLANNTGTSPVNPAYTNFPTSPSSQTANLTAGTSYSVQVTFGSYASQGVAVWIDFDGDGVFATPSERIGFTPGLSTLSFETVTFPISLPCNPVPGSYRMRVRDVWNTSGGSINPCTNYGYGETEDYTVTVLPPPPCPNPSAGVISAPSFTGGTIDWTIGCVETQWDFHIVAAGSPAPLAGNPGNRPDITAKPYTFSGLTSGTAYDVYYRADCGGGGSSSWIGPVSITTACLLTLPVTQNFNTPDAAGIMPTCYSQQQVVNTGNLRVVASSSNPTTTPYEGGGYLLWNGYSITGGSETRLITPAIVTTGTASVDVNFKWFSDNTNYVGGVYVDEGVFVEWSTSPSGPWNVVLPQITRNSTPAADGWRDVAVTLPGGAGNQAEVYVSLRFLSRFGNNCSLDNLVIAPTPTCFPPTNLTATVVSGGSSNLSWTAPVVGAPSNYNWEVRTSGVGGGGALGLVASGSTPTLAAVATGLNPIVNYTLWVKTDCVLPDVSTWASAPMPGPCVSGTNTFITVTPTCNNIFNEVATTQQAGQYIVVNVTNGTGYFFRSSNTNDWITLTNNTTNSVLSFSSGGGTLPWLATFTGAVRMYINTPNCGSQAIARTTSIRCGSPLNNDVAVEQIVTLGRLPKTPISTTHVVRARITNLGFATQTKTVTLAVSGSTTFSNTQSITLAPGVSGVVTFTGYAVNTAGTNTLTVSVPADNNNANNTRTFTQTVTNAIVGFAGPSETVIPAGVGFNGTEGYFVAKLNSQTPQNINEIKVFFEFTGRDFRYGIWAADGPGGTPGTNLFLSGALTTNAGPAFLPVSPAVAVNGDYFVGIDQSSTVNVGFRYVAESPLRSGVFYSSTYGTLVSPWVDFGVSGNSNFKLAIEVQYQQNTPPECAVVTPVPSQCQTDPTDVILNWASGGGAPTAFDLYYGTAPNPPLFQANLTATTWNLGPANLLGAGTKYWRVVPKNAFGNATCPTVSNFAVNNLGCVCIPTYTNGKTAGDLISRVQILGTTFDNNSGISPVNPAYTVFTGQANYTASLTASQSYTVRATIGSYNNQGVAAWLDANEDGVFSPSEKIGSTGATNIGTAFGSADFPIVIPCNPTPGVKRLRVRCVWITTGSVMDPCANYSYGEAEDYDITILPPPPCPVPTSGILNSATPTTANIGWTAGCTETEWDVYVALPSAPAPGLLTPATYPSQNTNTLNITGLTAATNYVFYVRSNCNLFTQSAWAGPYTFRTALVNDNIDGAIEINPAIAANFITIDNTFALNGTPPTPNTSALGNRDVWYKATVPASGVIAITTADAIPADPNMGDSYIQAWTTSDDTPTGTPTVLGINDDGGLGAHSHLYLSGLTPGKVVYIQVRAHSDTYFGKLRLAVNQAVQWTGTTDQSYSGANWYRDAVPTATERIYIPATTNQPVVAVNSTVAGIYMTSTARIGINTGITLSNTGNVENTNGATGRSAIYGLGNLVQTNTVERNVIGNVGVQNLTINGSGGLTIDAAASLWSYGTITPTLGTLTTNAKLTLVNPQFIVAPYTTREGQIAGGAGTVSGDVTVQRYIAKNGYHFISNPTTGGLTTNLTWGSSFPVAGPFNYVYSSNPNAPQPNPFPTIWTIDETVTNTSFVNGWVSGNQQDATSGRGFVASITTARMTSVVGPVSNGSESVNVSFTDDGYNLIGNPFPGGLAINNTVTPANGFLSNPANAAVIAGGMWIWNPNVNNYSSVNANGIWTNAPSGTVAGQGRVPHSQSFIVYKTAPGVSSVSFNSSMRNTTSVQNFLSTPAVARLQVSNFGRTDEAVVYVDASATDEFDTNLDAFKFMSTVDPSTPYIFTKNTINQNLSINTYGSINESMIIPVGVYVGTEGNTTITATDLEAFSGFSAVYLEDKVAGKLINLKETPSYTVKLSEGNSGDRFQLRFTNISENNANVSTSNQLNIFASDSRVFVNIPQEGNSRIEVMNILGQNLVTVDATSFKGLKEVSIPNVVAGSYLVKVTNGGKVYTQKVVLTNKQ